MSFCVCIHFWHIYIVRDVVVNENSKIFHMQSLVEFIIIKVKKEISDQNVIDIKNFNLFDLCFYLYKVF